MPPWEVVMAAHDPNLHPAVCAAPKAQARPTTFPPPGTAGKPWHQSCSVAHEEQVANCCSKNYMKAMFSSYPKLSLTKPHCQRISALLILYWHSGVSDLCLDRQYCTLSWLLGVACDPKEKYESRLQASLCWPLSSVAVCPG